MNISVLLSIIMAATVVTNIIVQVVKSLTWDKIPTNLVAFIVAQAVTLLSFFGYVSYEGIEVAWYTVVAAVAVGFGVSYAAMFGFDKLKEMIDQIGKIESRK